MAGLPAQIINTSEKILKDLEQKKPSNKVNEIDELQLTIFDNNSFEMKEIKKILDNVDIENMTPVDSLVQLSKLKQILKNKELDWHMARLRHCGEKKIAGIRFKKDSPYYDLCSDIEIVPKANQVLPHTHKIDVKP